jgi:hypothetical protein
MPRPRTVFAALFAAFVLLALAERFLVVEVLALRIALPLLLAACEVVACIGAGVVVRARLEWKRLDPVVDFLVGYPLFGTLCFLIGLVQVSTWTMLPLLVVCGLLGAYALSVAKPPLPRMPLSLPIAIVFLCALVAALAPPSSLDELTYHLAVPKQWLLEHRAIELPLLSHSYFPLGIESADLPSLALLGNDGGLASHLLHLACALAVALLIWRRTESALVTAAIVTTPALAIIAGWSLVDWPLIGACIVLWIGDDDATEAAALGAGLLIKYTFIPFAVIAMLAKRKWRPALLGIAIGCVFFVRNLVLTGNPLAPFFAAAAPHVMHYRGAPYLTSYIFDTQFIDESLGASLLALLPLASGLLPLALLAAAIALFFLAPSSRLLVPYLVVPAMSAKPPRWMRWLLAIAIAVQTLLVVYYVDRTGAFGVLAGDTDRAYLTKARPSYASIEWLNAALPPDSRTLVIGTGETFWLDRRVRGGGNFDSQRVSRYLTTPAPEALRERLRKDGITHVAIVSVTAPPTSVLQKIEERQTRLTPAAQRMLAQMLDRYASTVMARGAATVFTLR